MPVQLLTAKLVQFIAPLSSGRTSRISCLDVRIITYRANSAGLQCNLGIKIWKKIKRIPILNCLNLQKINFVLTISKNLKLTFLSQKSWPAEDKKQLSVCYTRIHHPVTMENLSCWLKENFQLNITETAVFSNHSTRSVTVLKSWEAGLSMSETLKRGQWNNSTTFGKFNNKPIHKEGSNHFYRCDIEYYFNWNFIEQKLKSLWDAGCLMRNLQNW